MLQPLPLALAQGGRVAWQVARLDGVGGEPEEEDAPKEGGDELGRAERTKPAVRDGGWGWMRGSGEG